MKIEFVGGPLDGEERELSVLFPNVKTIDDSIIPSMVCKIKKQGTYKAKKFKGKWVMFYSDK